MYKGLRDLRVNLGISQAMMASYLGLKTRNAYAMKERGDRRFSVEEAILISRVLGDTVESIFSSVAQVNKMVTNGGEKYEN